MTAPATRQESHRFWVARGGALAGPLQGASATVVAGAATERARDACISRHLRALAAVVALLVALRARHSALLRQRRLKIWTHELAMASLSTVATAVPATLGRRSGSSGDCFTWLFVCLVMWFLLFHIRLLQRQARRIKQTLVKVERSQAGPASLSTGADGSTLWLWQPQASRPERSPWLLKRPAQCIGAGCQSACDAWERGKRAFCVRTGRSVHEQAQCAAICCMHTGVRAISARRKAMFTNLMSIEPPRIERLPQLQLGSGAYVLDESWETVTTSKRRRRGGAPP